MGGSGGAAESRRQAAENCLEIGAEQNLSDSGKLSGSGGQERHLPGRRPVGGGAASLGGGFITSLVLHVRTFLALDIGARLGRGKARCVAEVEPLGVLVWMVLAWIRSLAGAPGLFEL